MPSKNTNNFYLYIPFTTNKIIHSDDNEEKKM